MEIDDEKKVTDIHYYYQQIEKYSAIKKEAFRQKILFFQNILLVSASIVGIVISLHKTNSQHLCIQLVFLLSIILLSLGIVCLVLVLFDFSTLEDRSANNFHDEIEESMKKGIQCGLVDTRLRKSTLFFEICSYVFLFAGFILLISYTGLVEFKQENIKNIKKEKQIEIIKEIKSDSLTTKQNIKKHD